MASLNPDSALASNTSARDISRELSRQPAWALRIGWAALAVSANYRLLLIK